jgi:hypothetical protein
MQDNDWRLQLVPGDRVSVRRDDGRVEEREVRLPAWQLGHGAWVIGLKGISGGYSLERVESRAVEDDDREPINPADYYLYQTPREAAR